MAKNKQVSLGTAPLEALLRSSKELDDSMVDKLAEDISRRYSADVFYLGCLFLKTTDRLQWCRAHGFRKETVRKYGTFARAVGWEYYQRVNYSVYRLYEKSTKDLPDVKDKADRLLGRKVKGKDVVAKEALPVVRELKAWLKEHSKVKLAAVQALDEATNATPEPEPEQEATTPEQEATTPESEQETSQPQPIRETTTTVKTIKQVEYAPPAELLDKAGFVVNSAADVPDVHGWLIDYIEERNGTDDEEMAKTIAWLRANRMIDEDDELAQIS